MSDTLLASAVFILALAFVYFGGRLLWLLIGGSRSLWVARRESARAMVAFRHELTALPIDALRQRLLTDAYFNDSLRAQPPVASFLARIAQGDEVALRVEFTQRRLYETLVAAERKAGVLVGRPLAMDAIDELYALLDELASRGRRARMA